jgi:methionyl-tRNA formyltransferase
MNDKNLRIVFMGTPEFAVESLKILIENHYQIVGVVTAPDKPAGRGQKLQQSPVKEFAVDWGLTVLQPSNLKDPEFLSSLKELKADLQVIVAFRMLPEVVWNMPSLGSFNLHGSLLPHYRGAAPINWAVMNGENETGVTTFFLKHEIDTGNILFQSRISITPEDNAGTIHDKLMIIGAELVLKTVQAIETNTINPLPQDNLAAGELKSAPKIYKDDCRINWSNSTLSIQNHIRGLSPYPAAWTELHASNQSQLSIKIFQSRPLINYALKTSEVESDAKTYLRIGTLDGAIEILTLQLAGKKKMDISEFLRGNKISNAYVAQ